MQTSAAEIVKSYLEKYICVNVIKTKKNKYVDKPLARSALSVACLIVEEMNNLIRSNKADDFITIKKCLKNQVNEIHQQLREKQTFLQFCFHKTKLPPDFGRCVNDAWYYLWRYEKQHADDDDVEEVAHFASKKAA